jgi:hypothetical protein
VKEGLALRQAVTGPHTKNLTLPDFRENAAAKLPEQLLLVEGAGY